MPNDGVTFEEILNKEHELVLTAEQKYGHYFTHAQNMVGMINNLVLSVDRPSRIFFLSFLSQVKNNLLLALFSSVRLHHVQKGMNLRQVLEAGAWAAYGMVHENQDLFYIESSGRVETPRRLEDARNNWLTQNYPEKSEQIKNLKEQINDSVAHTNVVYTFQNFGASAGTVPGFTNSFFDFEDEFQVKIDLLSVANFAMGMIDLFGVINQAESVFQVPENFGDQFRVLIAEHNELRTEVGNHPRFQGLINPPQNNERSSRVNLM